jgi:hypothetical protein
MLKRGRGRPQSSNSKAALKKRLQRAKKEGRAVTLLGGLTIKDAEAWFEILKEDTNLIPSFANKNDEPIILRATVAWINDACSEWRREQAKDELDAFRVCHVGQLEKEQPPELKDKGIRFRVPDYESELKLPNLYIHPLKRGLLWNPPTKRDRGRHLSEEEIAAWEEENAELLAKAHYGDSADDTLKDGDDDDGFDDAEDYDAEGYEGFEE